MPQDAVRDLAKYFTGLYGQTWGILPWEQASYGYRNYGGPQVTYDDIWAWVDTFKVRFRMRAKRGSKAQVKRARAVAKLEKLKGRLQYYEDDIAHQEARLENARKKFANAKETIKKLSEELGV